MEKSQYDLLIAKADLSNSSLNELIEKIIRFGNIVGLDHRSISKVTVTQIFGEGIKITLDTNYHFKII